MTKETNTNNNFYKWPKIEFRAKVAAPKSVSGAALFNVDWWLCGFVDCWPESCWLKARALWLRDAHWRTFCLVPTVWQTLLMELWAYRCFCFHLIFVCAWLFSVKCKKYCHRLLLGPAATWAHLSVGASVDLLPVICKIHCLAIFAVVCCDFFSGFYFFTSSWLICLP